MFNSIQQVVGVSLQAEINNVFQEDIFSIFNSELLGAVELELVKLFITKQPLPLLRQPQQLLQSLTVFLQRLGCEADRDHH